MLISVNMYWCVRKYYIKQYNLSVKHVSNCFKIHFGYFKYLIDQFNEERRYNWQCHFTSSNTNLTYIRSCLSSLKTENRQSLLNILYKTNTETHPYVPALVRHFDIGPV